MQPRGYAVRCGTAVSRAEPQKEKKNQRFMFSSGSKCSNDFFEVYWVTLFQRFDASNHQPSQLLSLKAYF